MTESLAHVDLWDIVINDLVHESSPVGYNTWISKLTPHSLSDKTFVLNAPDEVVKQTIDHRYLNKITSSIKKHTGKTVFVEITLDPYMENTSIKLDKPASPANLLPRYTFRTFVKGKNSELAFAASMAVAESPGKTSYNPLFLYGGVGLGKTHLMQSIGNYILDFDPNMNVIYTTSENMVNHFVASIRNKDPEPFRERYRNADVLMVDDVQFLIEKDASQEEFFHTFNALFFANKQIVLSSDKHPSELKALEERLTSRFGSGLVVDISRPDYETRLAILEKKAEPENIPIPDDVLQYLAKNISSNIRDLEGALIKVIAKAKLTKSDITLALAAEATRDVSVEKRVLDIPLIQEVVASHFGVTPDEIRSKKRTAHLSHARHVAMFLTRKTLNLQLTSIGKEFGGRDHSTVSHAVDKLTEEIEQNIDLQNELAELERNLREQTK